MPHAAASAAASRGDDFGSTDEVKVYKDEGGDDENKSAEENLTEEKLGLLTETEQVVGGGEGDGIRRVATRRRRPYVDRRLSF